MLPLMSMASTRSSGESSLTTRGQRLRHAILEDREILLLQPADELPVVGDDDGHQDGLDAGLFRVAKVPGTHVFDQRLPSARTATTRM